MVSRSQKWCWQSAMTGAPSPVSVAKATDPAHFTDAKMFIIDMFKTI